MSTKTKVLIAATIGLSCLTGLYLALPDPHADVSYKQKSLEEWFYGERGTFFHEKTRNDAQTAINALGTNAFPFLLSNLESKRGNQAWHSKFYQAMPRWIQSKMSIPLSGDDLKYITLGHIRQMPKLPATQSKRLTECVPALKNPRLRFGAFNLIRVNYQTDESFLILCRKLMNDPHPGIKLEAAIDLGEYGLTADPSEPELFTVLMGAFTNAAQRKMTLDLNGYTFRQQPPGGTGAMPFAISIPGYNPKETPDDMLRADILTALYRLERHLNQDQRDTFRNVIKDK